MSELPKNCYIAKRDVICWKNFQANGMSPSEGFDWGKLTPNKVLEASAERSNATCAPGVHAWSSLEYAKTYPLNGWVTWKCVVPKGTFYHRTKADGKKLRADRLKLLVEVHRKKRRHAAR